MTKSPHRTGSGEDAVAGSTVPCRWCRGPVPVRVGAGRPRAYCRRTCRQRDYEARRRAAAHGLDEAELVVARADADRLRDAVYVLRCAVEDVTRDLADDDAPPAVADALRWLLAAASTVLEAADERPRPARV